MHQQKSKKILIYFFLFLIIGTFNNKYFNNFNFPKIDKVEIIGLDENNSFELLKNLSYLKLGSLFFIDKSEINKVISSNELVENYSVFKKYPSSLKIKIIKTKFLANLKKEGDNFFLGSNGKLIRSYNTDENLPFIFGKFEKNAFFNLRKIINKSNFKFNEIKNFFYFKSGRWDIETYSGIKIKLPNENIKESLDLSSDVLIKSDSGKIFIIDLRQKNQIIIDEKKF
tara:strand:+ start:324 stop:1004 length:681 start_codon:yes stop_codon:yes gene_type:complete